jgi:acyl-CoA synthetase (AMP-forming)/AMP-acid ligase II
MTDTATASCSFAAGARSTGGLGLGHLLTQLAALHRDHLAIVDGSARISYAQLDARVHKLAASLAARGVGRGDRVAALLLDGLALTELLLATARLGAVMMPLNWRLAANELAFIVGHSAPRILFASERFRALAAAAAPALVPVCVEEGEPHALGEYAAFVQAAHTSVAAPDDIANDPWLMLYTSGTTGQPKGCLLAQSGWLQHAWAMATRLALTPQDGFTLTAPMFHSAGIGQLLAHLLAGCRIVFPPRSADAPALRAIWAAEGCTHVSPPPTMIADLLALERATPLAQRIRLWTMGASLNPPQLVQQVMDTYRTRTIHGFGQTEVSGFASFLWGEDQVERPSALGQPLPTLQVRVVDDAGADVAPGQPGELWLRGPSVMLGYWNDPAASEAALAGGWLHTGDIVRVDAEAYWHFVARKKELIKSLGENVYPAEVEHALLQHPGVAECAIFGVPDPRLGEAVKAVIVLRDGHALTGAEVQDWCRARLAGYKRPRYVEFIAEMPRSPVGKVHTLALRQRPVTPEQALP